MHINSHSYYIRYYLSKHNLQSETKKKEMKGRIKTKIIKAIRPEE